MPTILVADDNSNIQKMVGIALKDQGIEVVAVGNGEAAVRKLAESVPDLILADIFMPVRNGYEVCEYVKKDDRFAHVPVVLLVGAFDPLDEREVERVRADAVLKKPFVPPEPLIELVKSLLGKAAAAAAPAQEAAPEDVEQTQDVGMAAHSPTGTLRMPAPPEPPPAERTQRLEPEPPSVEKTQRLEPELSARVSSGTAEIPRPAAPGRSGTVEVPRPDVAPPDKTQRLEPEQAPGSAEGFKLDLTEPAPAQVMEKTAKLSATDISKILTRESSLAAPAEASAEEEFAVPPSVVDFQGEESPLAFEDMLKPTEEEEAEEAPASSLEIAEFEEAEEQEGEEEEVEEKRDEAEIRFGGIREEAKTPDPEMPPIPVDFGHSEPMELITEENWKSSEHKIGPPENLVSSSSGWAASTADSAAPTGAPEPGLEHEGSEGFLTPPSPPATVATRGIASEEVSPTREFAVPAPAEAAPAAADQFEETSELPKHILQEEVTRAQEIAARVAAQNREFLAQEESAAAAAGAPLTGPAIDQAITAADTILARHRAQVAAAEVGSAAPVAHAEPVAETVKVPRPPDPELIERISDRVLAQLDPYIIEKISKEIVRPMIEAMIRKELEKLD